LSYGKVLLTATTGVATEQHLASLAGYNAIREGGNAFDAATAASFALAVTLPHMNGLGGDFFALFREGSSGAVRCINGSGWAPSGATVEKLKGEVPSSGPNSAVVPGMVRGVHELHRRFGKLEFGRLLKGAIKMAEEGFPMSPGLARATANAWESFPTDAWGVFSAGGPPASGTTLRQPKLAETLREISSQGPDAFYSGTTGERVREAMASGGLEVTPEDLSSLRPEWVEPLRMEYHGRDVFEVPPNSMGAATFLILKQLEGMGGVKADSVRRMTEVTEATKVAWEAKEEMLGDPRFVDFDLDRFMSFRRRGGPATVAAGDTTYFAIADGRGNLLSCVQSLFHPFGSKVYVRGSGFFLNSRGSGFRVAGPNKVEPRKRPVHTLSALLVSRGGSPTVAIGASAGEYRPQLHALFASNLIDYSMSLEEAIRFPRFAWTGKETLVEPGYGAGIQGVPGLVESGPIGVAQGVEVLGETKKSVCDPRGDGLPAGG
jgi:gamma-glutamyltranspeptidase / glutathione hydrolase